MHNMLYDTDVAMNCVSNVIDTILDEFTDDIVYELRNKYPDGEFTSLNFANVVKNVVSSSDMKNMVEKEVIYEYKTGMFDAMQYLLECGYTEAEISKLDLLPTAIHATVMELKGYQSVDDRGGIVNYIIGQLEGFIYDQI